MILKLLILNLEPLPLNMGGATRRNSPPFWKTNHAQKQQLSDAFQDPEMQDVITLQVIKGKQSSYMLSAMIPLQRK